MTGWFTDVSANSANNLINLKGLYYLISFMVTFGKVKQKVLIRFSDPIVWYLKENCLAIKKEISILEILCLHFTVCVRHASFKSTLNRNISFRNIWKPFQCSHLLRYSKMPWSIVLFLSGDGNKNHYDTIKCKKKTLYFMANSSHPIILSTVFWQETLLSKI